MTNGLAPQLLMFGAIFAIFYFVLIRPQQQQRKKHEQAILGLKKGDEIITTGGIIGEVVFIKNMGSEGAATLDDRITVKSGESRLVVHRGKIVQIVGVDTSKSASSSDATPKA